MLEEIEETGECNYCGCEIDLDKDFCSESCWNNDNED